MGHELMKMHGRSKEEKEADDLKAILGHDAESRTLRKKKKHRHRDEGERREHRRRERKEPREETADKTDPPKEEDQTSNNVTEPPAQIEGKREHREHRTRRHRGEDHAPSKPSTEDPEAQAKQEQRERREKRREHRPRPNVGEQTVQLADGKIVPETEVDAGLFESLMDMGTLRRNKERRRSTKHRESSRKSSDLKRSRTRENNVYVEAEEQ